MPIVEPGPGLMGYLVYEAPVNDAAKKLRERFDVDDETGYPRAYGWRNMAKLGNEYKYEDPYLKFNPYKDEEFISQRYTLYGVTCAIAAGAHWYWCMHRRIPYWSKLFLPISYAGGFCLFVGWAQKQTIKRYNLNTAILIDYTRKHPERFGTLYRPKLREVLCRFAPNR